MPSNSNYRFTAHSSKVEKKLDNSSLYSVPGPNTLLNIVFFLINRLYRFWSIPKLESLLMQLQTTVANWALSVWCITPVVDHQLLADQQYGINVYQQVVARVLILHSDINVQSRKYYLFISLAT